MHEPSSPFSGTPRPPSTSAPCAIVDGSQRVPGVRQDVAEPPQLRHRGAMVTVIDEGRPRICRDQRSVAPRACREAIAARAALAKPPRDACVVDYRAIALPRPRAATLAVEQRPATAFARRDNTRCSPRESQAVPHRRSHRRLGSEPLATTRTSCTSPPTAATSSRNSTSWCRICRRPPMPSGDDADAHARRPLQRLLPAGRSRGARRAGFDGRAAARRRRGAGAARGAELPEPAGWTCC